MVFRPPPPPLPPNTDPWWTVADCERSREWMLYFFQKGGFQICDPDALRNRFDGLDGMALLLKVATAKWLELRACCDSEGKLVVGPLLREMTTVRISGLLFLPVYITSLSLACHA